MKTRNAERGMRNENKRFHRAWFAVVGLLMASTSLHAQPQDIRTSAKADTHAITLADWVHVTVTIEGQAPLRVEVPQQLLTNEANRAWRIKTDEPVPSITPLSNGREEWKHVYKLSAWKLEDLPAITFAPFIVNGQSKTFDGIKVTVNRIGGPSAPAQPKPQPITLIEDVPPPPPSPSQSNVYVWPCVVGTVLLMGALVLIAARMRARTPQPLPPTEWALQELAQIESRDALDAEAIERVAEIVRTFIQRRFVIPATKLTTTELLAAATQQGWSVEETDSLRVLLDECDRVKFAGDLPDNDGCRRLVRLAIDWINHIRRPVEPR